MKKKDEYNQSVYESDALAVQYAQQQPLQPPEETILEIVKRELAPKRMLDIGVGGGRTTHHFAALVEEYVGIDYSRAMIAACESRFRELANAPRFLVADVRSMPVFADEQFDFVLFSYNGLDYVAGPTRAQALAEIRRVLRRGGYFALSGHNLRSLARRLAWSWSGGAKAMASRMLWKWHFRRNNPGLRLLARSGATEVNDGALDFRLRTYYQQPETQVEELQTAGFREIQAFRLADGGLIRSERELRENSEDWLYYLCVR
ncbi:MAG TPA: class I SAM-dependent methyltransferase [Terriglobales bacterium]|nr:class I SAM-dependent methyltransferase [Terriglobales bacterium]